MTLLTQPRTGAPAHDPVEAARDWLAEFGGVALATVVSTWGSSPVPVGGQLVVAPNGEFAGSVSGGCIEVDVITEAMAVLQADRPRLLEFGVEDETAWRSGLPCGGTLKVFVESLRATDGLRFIDAVLQARRARSPLAVVTDLATGARRICPPAELGDDLKPAVARGESCVLDTADGQAFLQVLAPSIRVVAVGATHIAQVLAELARPVGYDIVIVDPRTAFASAERFRGLPTLTDWPDESLAKLKFDARTALVALTHAAHLDDAALAAALRSDCLYIGALGSRTTHAKRLERLRAAGFTDAALGRIHAPIGLAIGAKGPAEIAVSILAEIVKTARQPHA